MQNAFHWIEKQDVSTPKELARLIEACELWNVKNEYTSKLIELKNNNNWDNSVRETSRACSALATSEIDLKECAGWLLSKQDDNGSWENDVYDTTYALIALANMKICNTKGCQWLIDNYSERWAHVGTTSLIVTTLKDQGQLDDTNNYSAFINEHTEWIFSKRANDGGWNFISTSNLVIQALIKNSYLDQLASSIKWLRSKQNSNGSWGKNNGEIAATALSLITLGSLQKQ